MKDNCYTIPVFVMLVIWGLFGIIVFICLLCVGCEDKDVEQAHYIYLDPNDIDVNDLLISPWTWSSVVAMDGGSYATGSFVSDGISPSVTARRVCGMRTSGSWAGWVLVEYYVPDEGWVLKDVDWSVWSSYNANKTIETFTPDRYRFRMVGYTGGRCDYQLIGS